MNATFKKARESLKQNKGQGIDSLLKLKINFRKKFAQGF